MEIYVFVKINLSIKVLCMKKKWWIILIIALLAIIWGLFLVQHFFLKKYGCGDNIIVDEPCRGMCHVTIEKTCSFKTFLLNEDVSWKLFIWFWINTKKLEKAREISTDNYHSNNYREEFDFVKPLFK